MFKQSNRHMLMNLRPIFHVSFWILSAHGRYIILFMMKNFVSAMARWKTSKGESVPGYLVL